MMHKQLEHLRPKREDHERFERLCALSTSGALTSSEWSSVAEHLKECSVCRYELSQYQELASTGMALLAPIDPSLDVENEWSPETAVAKCMSRLQGEPRMPESPRVNARSSIRLSHWLSIPRLSFVLPYAAAGIFLVAVSLSFYVLGSRAGERRVNNQPRSAAHYGSRLDALLREHAALQSQLTSRANEMESLHKQLLTEKAAVENLRLLKDSADESIRRLQKASTASGEEIAALQSQNRALEQRQIAASEKLTQSETNLAATGRKLDVMRDQHAADLTQIASLEERIAIFANHPQSTAYVAVQQRELAADQDLRDLMGARNLFIADVYDIDKAGLPQKPFGRVFYTKGKSLLFYAFDLDRQPGVKSASTFQVWGRRGYGDRRPINMGMMYLDNAVSKRWVLKYDDAKALAQVDAVYVTIEPRGGSDEPKGRQLLYASLRTPSNHP